MTTEMQVLETLRGAIFMSEKCFPNGHWIRTELYNLRIKVVAVMERLSRDVIRR